MALADLRALARTYAAAPAAIEGAPWVPGSMGSAKSEAKTEAIGQFPTLPHPGTPGTPCPQPRGSSAEPGKTAEVCGVHGRGTPGTPGTPSFDDVGEDGRAEPANDTMPAVLPAAIAAPDIVEALAEAMAANPAHRITGRERAMSYFRAEARRRLTLTDDPMVRGLLLGFERHASAMAVHAKGTGR